MTNWIERARHANSQAADRITANSAEGDVTAVMAVLHSTESEILDASLGSNVSVQAVGFREISPNQANISMTLEEEAAIRAWLEYIQETDAAVIAEVLKKCQVNLHDRNYLLRLAGEIHRPAAFVDDRRRCDQCANLTERGLCLAARRGEIVASRIHEPIRDLLQRCVGYAPKPTDPDQRPGRQRWPALI